MSTEPNGPFRRDGRMRFTSETRWDEAAQQVARDHATLEFPGYVVALSLGPVALAYFASSPQLLICTGLLLCYAWLNYLGVRAQRKSESRRGTHQTWISEGGVHVHGALGPSKWSWDAVESVRATRSHVVIRLAGREIAVLPVEGSEAERLVAFIRERTTSRITDHPGRLLFLLAVLYAFAIAAAVALLN